MNAGPIYSIDRYIQVYMLNMYNYYMCGYLVHIQGLLEGNENQRTTLYIPMPFLYSIVVAFTKK